MCPMWVVCLYLCVSVVCVYVCVVSWQCVLSCQFCMSDMPTYSTYIAHGNNLKFDYHNQVPWKHNSAKKEVFVVAGVAGGRQECGGVSRLRVSSASWKALGTHMKSQGKQNIVGMLCGFSYPTSRYIFISVRNWKHTAQHTTLGQWNRLSHNIIYYLYYLFYFAQK